MEPQAEPQEPREPLQGPQDPQGPLQKPRKPRSSGQPLRTAPAACGLGWLRAPVPGGAPERRRRRRRHRCQERKTRGISMLGPDRSPASLLAMEADDANRAADERKKTVLKVFI